MEEGAEQGVPSTKPPALAMHALMWLTALKSRNREKSQSCCGYVASLALFCSHIYQVQRLPDNMTFHYYDSFWSPQMDRYILENHQLV